MLGLLVGFGPLAGEDDLRLVVPRLFAGYLLGLLAAELFSRPPVRGAVRVASLQPRSASDLVPLAGRVLPWLVLTPLLFSPILAFGSHPRGVTRYSRTGSTCFGTASWPQMATLITAAALSGAALLATTLILRRLARRAQPADDPSMLVLDRALRASSARSAVAASAGLGCSGMSLIIESVYQGLHSFDCTRPLGNLSGWGNVYSWAPTLGPWLQPVSLGLLLAAPALWIICQRLPVPNATRHPSRR